MLFALKNCTLKFAVSKTKVRFIGHISNYNKNRNKYPGGIMVILLVFLLIFVCHVAFEIPMYAIVLFFIGLIILISAVSILVVNAQKKSPTT